jgi:hypothetical protein
MDVLPLTVFFSSLLAVFFILAFAIEWRRGRNRSLERESMLPFADEDAPRPAKPAATRPAAR